MDSICPVASCLAKMAIPQALLEPIGGKEAWSTFGKKNAYSYREELMKRFKTRSLGPAEIFMVYFFCASRMSHPGVLSYLDAMSEEAKSLDWFPKVRAFFDSDLTQYECQARMNKKFLLGNVPATYSSQDLLCFLFWTPKEEHTISNLSKRTTFSQLALSDEMQGVAKEGYKAYWDSMVKNSRDPAPKPEMMEEYYANHAGDRDSLVSTTLKLHSIPDGGYTREDLERWIHEVDDHFEKIKSDKIAEETTETESKGKST